MGLYYNAPEPTRGTPPKKEKPGINTDVRGGRVVDGPDADELVELVRTEDAAVASQVLEAVRDDRHEQIQHLTSAGTPTSHPPPLSIPVSSTSTDTQ